MKNLIGLSILLFLLFPLTGSAQDSKSAAPLSSDQLASVKVYYDLESALAEPDKVYKLSLRGKKIKKFPPEILSLPNLQVLALDENKLKKLPSEIGGLRNLQILTLGGNKFKDVPQAIDNLQNLVYLSLSRNKLMEIPSWLGGLPHLKRLELGGNFITASQLRLANYFLPNCLITI